MEIKRKSIEPRAYEKSHSEKIACSKCGRVLMSSHEGIIGDNNIAFCEYCYKSLLFPNLHENCLEIVN
jgi:formylmethanofuran dehydrogenase subunit E